MHLLAAQLLLYAEGDKVALTLGSTVSEASGGDGGDEGGGGESGGEDGGGEGGGGEGGGDGAATEPYTRTFWMPHASLTAAEFKLVVTRTVALPPV